MVRFGSCVSFCVCHFKFRVWYMNDMTVCVMFLVCYVLFNLNHKLGSMYGVLYLIWAFGCNEICGRIRI